MKKRILTALAAAIAQGAFAADITVSAAASLTDAFGDIAKAYQAKYPDTELSKKLGISRKSLWEKRKKYDVAKKK